MPLARSEPYPRSVVQGALASPLRMVEAMDIDDLGNAGNHTDHAVVPKPTEALPIEKADGMEIDEAPVPQGPQSRLSVSPPTPGSAALPVCPVSPIAVPAPPLDNPMDIDDAEASPTTHGQEDAAAVPSDFECPPQLRQFSLMFNKVYKTIHCVQKGCRTAVRANSILSHLENHKVSFKKGDKQPLLEYVAALGATSEHPNIPQDVQPIEGLHPPIDGHCCNLCNYCVPKLSSFKQHWKKEHADEDEHPGNERFHMGLIQTFYVKHPQYFKVFPGAPLPKHDPFSIFLRVNAPQIKEAMEATMPLPVDGSEVNPLLQITNWDVHMEPWMTDRTKLRDLLKLRNPPSSKDPEYLNRLVTVVEEYMSAVCKIAVGTPVVVRQMLKVFPR